MTDKDRQFELNDELLSAYLDGELSADERAAVEARLATDSAAQQMLHELRSVSQSVQALPTQSLGRDLSEEILRRAREAKPSLAGTTPTKASLVKEPARPASSMPKIRAFHSKRAIIWAAMTLAAGLLIMIVQSSDKANKQLPPVAGLDRATSHDKTVDEPDQVHREVSISAASQASAPPPTAVAESESKAKETRYDIPMSAGAPTSGEPASPLGKVAPGGLAGGPAGPPGSAPIAAATPALKLRKEEVPSDSSSLATPMPSQVASDKAVATSSTAPNFTREGASLGGALTSADAKQKSSASLSPTSKGAVEQYFVVHIVAKPEALQNGSFDRLLAANKVEFISQPAGQRSGFAGGKILKQAQSEAASAGQRNKSAAVRTTDVVLVEAPTATIEMCLADLRKNSADFPTIAVSEQPRSQDRFDANGAPAKKLAENVKRFSSYNRGALAESQKDSAHYFEYLSNTDKSGALAATNGATRIGGGGGGGPSDQGGIGGEAAKPSADQDAKRNPAWGFEDRPLADIRRARQIGEPASAGGLPQRNEPIPTPAKDPQSQRRAGEQLEAKADTSNNLRVLFVVTTDQAGAPAAGTPSVGPTVPTTPAAAPKK